MIIWLYGSLIKPCSCALLYHHATYLTCTTCTFVDVHVYTCSCTLLYHCGSWLTCTCSSFLLSDQHLSLPDNIKQLRDMLAGKTFLTPQAARRVVECVTSGLFQHHRLFQYLFEEQQSKLQIDLSVYTCMCAYKTIHI